MPRLIEPGGPSAGAFGAAVGLAGLAGWVDAVAFLDQHVYVANMTGVVVMIGVHAAEADLLGALHQAAVLLSFLLGVIASRTLLRLRQGPGPSYAAAALLVAACVGPAGRGLSELMLLAAAMGLQNAALNVFGGIGLNTTFITGNVQRIGETLADPPKPGFRRAFPLGLLPSVLLCYATGAGGGALALRHLQHPLLLPALALVAASAIALLRARPPAPVTAAVPAGRTPPR